jgi:hypothetical protein
MFTERHSTSFPEERDTGGEARIGARRKGCLLINFTNFINFQTNNNVHYSNTAIPDLACLHSGKLVRDQGRTGLL